MTTPSTDPSPAPPGCLHCSSTLPPLPLSVPHPTLSLSLRAVVTSDAPDISTHANDERVTQYLPPHFPRPYLLSDAQTFITNTHIKYSADHSLPSPPVLASYPPSTQAELCDCHSVHSTVIALEGKAIGHIFTFPRKEGKPQVVGYWLGATYHRRGIMTAVLKRLIAWREAEWKVEEEKGEGQWVPTGWEVTVHGENRANLGVVKKLGFVTFKEEMENGTVPIVTLRRERGWQAPASEELNHSAM